MCLLRWAYCRGDSRLPAECRGSTGEADDAEPENLDSGPQVLLNLLCVDGLGSLWGGARLVWCNFGVGVGYGCYCLTQGKTEPR